MPRRDLVYVVSLRARKLTDSQAANAWFFLARHLDRLSERDLPKFLDLLAGIRAATIFAKLPRTRPNDPRPLHEIKLDAELAAYNVAKHLRQRL